MTGGETRPFRRLKDKHERIVTRCEPERLLASAVWYRTARPDSEIRP